jgi:hypothetical protein
LVERHRGEYHIEYAIIIDYGGVKDRCALGIMHSIPGSLDSNKVAIPDSAIVDRLDCWQGTHEARIDINIPYDDFGKEIPCRSVEGWIEVTRKHFRIGCIILDPMQLEGLAIKYEKKGIKVIRYNFRQGQGNHYMAQILKHAVQNKKVKWSPEAGRLPPKIVIDGKERKVEDDTMARELSMLIVKPMSYGYKFDHESGRHDDRACVVGMGLVYLLPQGTTEGMSVGPLVVKAEDEMGRPLDCSKDMIQAVKNWNLYGLGRSPQDDWDRW